jgi:putative SOS response-associated peptidase YedK
MCGRFTLTAPPAEIRHLFGHIEQPNYPPRYNIAPTQPIAVIHQNANQPGVLTRHFSLMRWGFLPGFVKDMTGFPLVINIRSETAREKPSFRAAFQRRRALIPADGFYEWQALGKRKQPFHIRRPDRKPFAFAALFETWNSADGSEIDTAAILTTMANGPLSALHDRSPVILPEQAWSTWLDARTPVEKIEPLLRPPPDDLLELVPVSSAVGRASAEGPELLQPPEPAIAEQSPAKTKPRKAASGGDDQGSLF